MLLLRLRPLIITGLILSAMRFSAAADCSGSANVTKTIVVDQDGRGSFETVQQAIDSVPSGNSQWIRIFINHGTYKEMVKIPSDKPCIFLDGWGKDSTTITYDGHDQTDTSATFSSAADYVVVQGITFKNSYNRYWSLLQEFRVKQAVAARIDGDKSFFNDCAFLGVQDTLWDVQGRHYFQSCYIEGAVDFIFGRGQSYFKNCLMNSTVGMAPYNLRMGFVTAQGRESESDPSGFIFDGGKLIGSSEVYLGRAWGSHSRVIFIGTRLDAPIFPKGWDAWGQQGSEKNFMYSEVDCGGAGSDKSKRVPWVKNLDRSQVKKQFSVSAFINQEGWLNQLPLSGVIKL